MKTQTKFELYKDRKKEWRWRAKRAGRIVATSGEGYKREAGCVRTLVRFVESMQRGLVVMPSD